MFLYKMSPMNLKTCNEQRFKPKHLWVYQMVHIVDGRQKTQQPYLWPEPSALCNHGDSAKERSTTCWRNWREFMLKEPSRVLR